MRQKSQIRRRPAVLKHQPPPDPNLHQNTPTLPPESPRNQGSAKKTATQKKLQRKKNCNAKKNVIAGPALAPSPHPKLPQTTPSLFLFFNLMTWRPAVPAKNLITAAFQRHLHCLRARPQRKKTATQKKMQRKKKLQCKENCKRVPTVVRAFDPSPYPIPPQTTPIHILALN